VETILDIFTTLNCAIDAGSTRQEALTIAIAKIIQQAQDKHERQALPLEWKMGLFKMGPIQRDGGTKGHWKVYCAAQISPWVG
jgi:hypothetical protein